MNEVLYVSKHSLVLSVPAHFHENWEFICCTGGKGYIKYDGGVLYYEEGDTVIIPPFISHSNNSDVGFTNIYMNMNNASLPFKEPTVIKDDGSRHIYDAFNSLHYHYYSKLERKGLVVSALAMLIISLFIAHKETSDISAIVQKIEANILENFPDCYYDLNDYLKQFHFNNDYIRKLFKKELGVTPNQYLIDKRLQTSSELLKGSDNDDTNISDVAMTCGFKDPLYFSRMFKKKFGISPSEYAKQKLDDEEVKSSDEQKVYLNKEVTEQKK